MSVEALSCPSCGAPLELDQSATAAVCVYCNTPLVVQRDTAGHGQLAPDADVPESVVTRVKEMLLLGQRDQAMAHFRQHTGRSEAEARKAIDDYASNVVAQKVTAQTVMNVKGVALLLLSVALCSAGIGLSLTSATFANFGILLAVVTGLATLAMLPGFVRTLKYLSASIGTATIKQHAYIGAMGRVHSYRLWLDVEEPNGNHFETELPFPVGETGRAKIHAGRRFRVKYFPGRPESVVFHAHIDG